MSNKPLSVSAFLQGGLPQRNAPPGIPFTRNRFEPFRDRSVSAVRSGSALRGVRTDSPAKRARPEDVDPDANSAFRSMADEEKKIARAKEIVVKVKEDLESLPGEGVGGTIRDVLKGIVEWMEITTCVQVATASVVVDSFSKVMSPSRKSRRRSPPPHQRIEQNEELQELDNRKKKFVAEVREAEKAILIFRTNMGSVPVMNTDTMKNRFTQDVSVKAAMLENRTNGRPTAETIAQLDDTLSMVNRMEYFGRVTKKATKKGEDGGRVDDDFYTIPVKLILKDKETKEAVESRLRGICKIFGNTPYHRTLRNVVNRAVDECKKKYPENFIQVKVVPDKMQLKINRRPLGTKTWHDNVETFNLPDSVLDLSRMGPRDTLGEDKMFEEATGGEQMQG